MSGDPRPGRSFTVKLAASSTCWCCRRAAIAALNSCVVCSPKLQSEIRMMRLSSSLSTPLSPKMSRARRRLSAAFARRARASAAPARAPRRRAALAAVSTPGGTKKQRRHPALGHAAARLVHSPTRTSRVGALQHPERDLFERAGRVPQGACERAETCRGGGASPISPISDRASCEPTVRREKTSADRTSRSPAPSSVVPTPFRASTRSLALRTFADRASATAQAIALRRCLGASSR